ncbi:FAD/NAD(P)-binding protein [Thermocrinis sp.]
MLSNFYLLKAKVEEVRQENQNTKRILLRVDGFPQFKPGQFNMLYASGLGEAPISISSLRRDLLEHTVRSAGDVTNWIFNLREGDYLGIRGPYGSYFPIEESKGKDILLLAGGLGLADIKPVVEFILSHREEYRRVHLLMGFKDPSGILYREEQNLWKEYINTLIIVGKASEGWTGRVGLITELIQDVDFDPENTVAMMCGPEGMMVACSDTLSSLGIKKENIHLSLERHMKCAVGTCGHCQLGWTFVCKHGPILTYEILERLLKVKEL